MTIKDKIRSYAQEGGKLNPEPRNKTGTLLFEAFYWQELEAFAGDRQKAAWSALGAAKLIESDDYYRSVASGEFLAGESKWFSCRVKVSSPRKSIDKEAFLEAVARATKTSVTALEALWNAHQKESRAPISKRILEV